jgi:peptide deformylase
MAVRKIIKYGNPILRVKAKPITRIDDSIRILAEDMIETMQFAEGIGLAAPQVAESISLCVVNMGLIEEGAEPKVFINPQIIHFEGECAMEEGCLSIPEIREEVVRAASIKIRYQDLNGVQHEEECHDMLARVLQHEVDHLNGVLFIDRISSIRRKLLAKKLKTVALESKAKAEVAY